MYPVKIILSFISQIKFNTFFLILVSTLSSLFNALSAISLIPIVSLLLGQEVNFKIKDYFEKVDFINFDELSQLNFIAIFLILFLIGSMFKILSDYLIIKIRVKILSLYFHELLENFFRADWHFLYMNDIGKISNSVYKELDKVGGSIIAVLHIFSNFFLISIIAFLPLIVSWKVTLISFIILLLLFTPTKILNIIFYNLGKKFTAESNLFSKLFFYAISMYKTITANASNTRTIQQIHTSYKKINGYEVINKILNSSISETLNILSILFVFIIFSVSTYHELSIPETSTILYAFLRIFPYINNSISMTNVIESSRPGYELIKKLKYESLKLRSSWGNHNFKHFTKEISLKNISYTYPNGKIALKNINIDFKAGQMIALVGQSGSGKSTILDLLAGLNKASSGSIGIDGKNLYEFKKESYQEKIGYVDSNVDLFPYSIRENVQMFENKNDEHEYEKVLKIVNMDKIIQDLPDKDNTLVGDKGSKLSSGQKQRLCIARALIKKPQIIIFDEATNYLDEKNEQSILENISKYKGLQTIFFATHKLDILKHFEKVLFIKDGKIEKVLDQNKSN